MDCSKSHDPGRAIDWSKTSSDYAEFRPGYPRSFYERIEVLGIGKPGQRILDLGTGTGVLARHFASQLAVYATGGEIEFADRRAIEELVRRHRERDFPVRSLIHGVVQSPLFTNR